jgi:hypothetical protein
MVDCDIFFVNSDDRSDDWLSVSGLRLVLRVGSNDPLDCIVCIDYDVGDEDLNRSRLRVVNRPASPPREPDLVALFGTMLPTFFTMGTKGGKKEISFIRCRIPSKFVELFASSVAARLCAVSLIPAATGGPRRPLTGS